MGIEARDEGHLSFRDRVKLVQQRLLAQETMAEIEETGDSAMFGGKFREVQGLSGEVSRVMESVGDNLLNALNHPDVSKLLSITDELRDAFGDEETQVYGKWIDKMRERLEAQPPVPGNL